MASNATNPLGFDLTEDRAYVTIVLVSVLLPLAAFFVGLRFYSRGYMSHNLGIDDWMSGWSMVMTIITGGLMAGEATTGLGRHRASLTDEEYRNYMKLFYVDVIFYIAGLAFIKLHVLLQYFRLFSVKMRRVTVWVTAVTCLWGAASTLAVIFVCWPVEAFWDSRVKGVCIPLEPQWYTNAVGNIITDLVIFALPIPMLWRLNLERHLRISLIAVFSLGFFTCCISIARIAFLHLVEEDETFHNTETSGWTIGEMSLAMIVSCIPTLRPILLRLFPSLAHSRRSSDPPALPTIKTFGGAFVRSSRRGRSQDLDGISSRRRGSSTVELTKLDDAEIAATKSPSTQSDNDSLPRERSQTGLRGTTDDLLGLRIGTETRVQTAAPPRLGGAASPTGSIRPEIRVQRDITQSTSSSA